MQNFVDACSGSCHCDCKNSIALLCEKVDQLQKTMNQMCELQMQHKMKTVHRSVTNSRRGLSLSNTLVYLESIQPSLTFSEWLMQVSKSPSLLDKIRKSPLKLEDCVFKMLHDNLPPDNPPVFAIKREKQVFIYEKAGTGLAKFRLMKDADLKRLIDIFKWNAVGLLNKWKASLRSDETDSDSDKSSLDGERHFQEKQYADDSNKINRLSLEENPQKIHSLLRKFNTYMLNARGIVFNGSATSNKN